MAVWLVRAGAKGEHENKFLDDNRIYLTKSKVDFDLSCLPSRDQLLVKMMDNSSGGYVLEKPRKVSNLASQIWSFGHMMTINDRVVMPSKLQPAIYIGLITSNYQYDRQGIVPYWHWRKVNWYKQAIPRSHFAKDLLSSFSAAMTICQIKRNDAELRLSTMERNGWSVET